MKNRENFLSVFLKIAPLSHALWRSVEALAFSRVTFKKPVLDIGCGFGEFAGVVFNKIEMGIDINNEDLKKAIKRARYKKVQWADARKMPFKNASYNTVISVSVLEHIMHAEKVIKEVSRILKKDGLFIFTVPTPTFYTNLVIPKILKSIGLESLGNKYSELHSEVFKHVNLQNKKWWIKNLKNSNFEIITAEGTASLTLLRLHELFLIFALPSQIWKVLFGKRLVISSGLRSKILQPIFGRFINLDKNSDINIFFIAKKLRQ